MGLSMAKQSSNTVTDLNERISQITSKQIPYGSKS